MLGDRAAGAGGDQSGGRGHVERAPPAARAGGVEQVRRARSAHAQPARASCAPAPRARRPSRPWCAARSGSPAICVSEASPCMISASTSAVSSALRSRRAASESIARVRIALGISRFPSGGDVVARSTASRKLPSSSRPCSVRTDSGWNCTPSAGSSRWRRPISTPSPARGLLQAVGQVGVDDQRVVAPDRQRRGQPAEDRAPVVLDRRRLAVHRRSAASSAAERLCERLVAETHAERGNARFGHPPGELERDPACRECRGRARPRSAQAVRRSAHRRSRGRCAPHHLRAQLAEILHEVVRERVVVVEHEDPHRPLPAVRTPARSRAAPPASWLRTPRTHTRAWRRRRCRRRPGRGRRRP